MGQTKKILINQDENFKLFIKQPVYLEKACTEGWYWKNTRTGENCGQRIFLCEFKYNEDGTENENPTKEEDVYELIFEGEEENEQ